MYAWFVVVNCLTIFRYVHGYCTFHGIKQEVTEFGSVRHYCEHENENIHHSGEEFIPPKPLQLMPGSSFETLDCRVCTCTDYGYICCRKGIASRLFYTPPGCMVKADGCNAVFVLASNPQLDCFTKMPIKHTRLIHKMHALMDKHKHAASGEGEGSPVTTTSPFDSLNMAPAYPSNRKSPAFGDFLFKLSQTALEPTTSANGGEGEGGATTTLTPPLDLFNLFNNNNNGPPNDPFFIGNSKDAFSGIHGTSDPYANLFGKHPLNPGQNHLSKNTGHGGGSTPPPDD